ncbi:unnamed protein product [Cylindrotheca closterium]|uniref:Uncharacterized protein n=1 Tax=Cylindrotheca closterium TaxID=2856 RepID=A0AAD2CWH9_9STRA|nr:unnamed protein product [Cylindrotheca closterium]
MTTTKNIKTDPTSMNASSTGMKRADEMKREFFLSKIPAIANVGTNDPMPNLFRCDKRSQFELIDEALRMVNTNENISGTLVVAERRGGPLRRKGSSLCERRASELLKDNSDHLSELLRKSQDGLVDFNSDDESDLED